MLDLPRLLYLDSKGAKKAFLVPILSFRSFSIIGSQDRANLHKSKRYTMSKIRTAMQEKC